LAKQLEIESTIIKLWIIGIMNYEQVENNLDILFRLNVVEFIHDRSINIDDGYKIVLGEVWVFGKDLVDAMMTLNTYKKKVI